MPINEALLSQIRCCLSNDGHIVQIPILMKCGSNCCKKCILGSNDEMIKCYNCSDKHKKGNLVDLPINRIVEVIISSCINDLYDALKKDIETVTLSLEGMFEPQIFLVFMKQNFLKKK
jgi:hypothetical protein